MESKRKLTEEEIERLLGIVELPRGVPRATAQSIQHLNRERLRAQLTDVEIYPTMVDELGKSLLQFYQKTQIQPGESVGVMTAQSIGERQTQTTLNTFHSCGQAIKTVVTGVPRFSELLNATTNPKAVNCNIFFNQATGSIDDLRRVIGSDFVDIRLSNLVQSKTVFTEPKRERWYDVWCQFHGRDFERFTHGLSYKLDLGKMFEHSITLSMVADKIEEAYGDASCVWSPDAFGVLDVWVDVADVDNDEGLFDTMEEARSTFLEEIVDEALEQLHICGIEGVKNIFYEKKQGEWMVETDGSNLRKIFAHPAVDMTRTVCNNVWEIYQTLGIEAARNFLVEEFSNVISADGTFVNASHALLLVDLMTYSGTIISVSRYGLKKDSCGPMAKASFEESLDNFLKAGAYSEKETTNGVSASIMLGKMARFGTGICDIVIDLDGLKNRPQVLGTVEEK
jgi:DNA-directed RNA polymerase II subunit RPB1